jgi:hypothetical protein
MILATSSAGTWDSEEQKNSARKICGLANVWKERRPVTEYAMPRKPSTRLGNQGQCSDVEDISGTRSYCCAAKKKVVCLVLAKFGGSHCVFSRTSSSPNLRTLYVCKRCKCGQIVREEWQYVCIAFLVLIYSPEFQEVRHPLPLKRWPEQ